METVHIQAHIKTLSRRIFLLLGLIMVRTFTPVTKGLKDFN
jgi:hypothetical protein